MFRKSVKAIVHSLGYEVTKRRLQIDKDKIDTTNGVKLYRYYKSDGSFDYEKYKKIQIAGNEKKIENVWAIEANISFLSDHIKNKIGKVEFGICHGTRRGKEQEWFRKYLNCNVIGTEISHTAKQFPHTIQWDFHEAKREWVEAVDFIYSNSFDHSYDPKKCLNVWMRCIRKNGICILEHTSDNEQATDLDPFGASIIQMPYLILTWGEGKFFVREILIAPTKPDWLKYVQFLIIQKA